MEVVLLWLDDLDDLVFLGAFQAHRLRVLALGFGALAASALTLCMLDIWGDAWVPSAALGAVLGVALWLSGGLLGEQGIASPQT